MPRPGSTSWSVDWVKNVLARGERMGVAPAATFLGLVAAIAIFTGAFAGPDGWCDLGLMRLGCPSLRMYYLNEARAAMRFINSTPAMIVFAALYPLSQSRGLTAGQERRGCLAFVFFSA